MMKMMMTCNPYEKTIDYYWFDESQGRYVDMSDMSDAFPELTNAKYTKDVTLQSRADEIVKIIDNLDPGDLGIEVHFIGTQDDFDDLKRVVELFYENKNIHCIKEAPFFWDAEYALEHIKTKFSEVESILAEYQEEAIVGLLDSYEKTIKPDLAICIMGLYSSGKSAFINSLVGAELLPSASDPTTAKVCKIQCRETHTVTCTVNGGTYTVCFDTDNPTVTGADEAVRTLIDGHIHEGSDRIARMYHYLKFLNASHPFGDVYTDGELITITVPYTNTLLPTDKFDFVIYDTPGSNSASNRKHFAVLNEALSAQTNALPIIMTTPDTMDSTDNDLLLDLIHNNANKLDTTNALIVVNKSDEKMNRALEEKKLKLDSLKLTKWKSTRIFFVSSLLGIASKKTDPHDKSGWYDMDMFELFEEKAHRYEDYSNGRSLYSFNIIDKSRVLAEKDLPQADAPSTQILLFNSGLASIELEITNYARRYAQYLKARESIRYLEKAVELCEQTIKNDYEMRDRLYKQISANYKEKEYDLTQNLIEYTQNAQEEITLGFQQKVKQIVTDFLATHKLYPHNALFFTTYIYKEFDAYWKYLRSQMKSEKIDITTAFQEMEQYVTDEFNKLLSIITEEFNKEVEAYWNRHTVNFKHELSRIVLDSGRLNEEQKSILNSFVVEILYIPNVRIEFSLEKHRGIKRGMISFIPLGKETYDNLGCCDSFISLLDEIISDKKEYAIVYYTNQFYEWSDSITNLVIAKLCSFNKELNAAGEEIQKLQTKIDKLTKEKEVLKLCSDDLKRILGLQFKHKGDI